MGALKDDRRLTEDENAFLALLARTQPATGYEIGRIYAESPVSTFGTSKGKIYPLIRRLHERGYIKKRKVPKDPRRTELLECTAKAMKAVRMWAKDIRPVDVLLDDPLRTKVQSFDLLTREEQLAWIVEAKMRLQEKLAELDAYAAEVTVPFKEMVHDNAVSSVHNRLHWLDRLLAVVVGGSPAS